jgi:hypothetical protein
MKLPMVRDPKRGPRRGTLVRRRFSVRATVSLRVGATRRHSRWAGRVTNRWAVMNWLGRVESWITRVGEVLARGRFLRLTRQGAYSIAMHHTRIAQHSSSFVRVSQLVLRVVNSAEHPLISQLAGPAPTSRLRRLFTVASPPAELRVSPAFSRPTPQFIERQTIRGYKEVRTVFDDARTIAKPSITAPPRGSEIRLIEQRFPGPPHSEHQAGRKEATLRPTSSQGPVDIEAIADQVLQRIERRAISWRERLGGA